MIDYKLLLIKYMANVGLVEGVYFLGHANQLDWISEEELNELNKLADLANEYDY